MSARNSSNSSLSLDIDEIYTIEDLEAYGTRLHYNTVVNLVVNIFTGFIVLKYSSKAMGNYKYYILLTIVTAGTMDLDATLSFGIYPTFPIPGFCGAGLLSKHLNYFWGEVIQYLILQELFSICGTSLVICILYRYFSLKGKIEFFHSPKGILIMSIFAIFYPSSITVLLFTTLDERNETLNYVKENAPNMYELYRTYGACNCFKAEKATPFALLMFLHIAFIWIIGLTFVLKTIWELSAKRKSLSVATYKMYKEFLYAIIIQCSVPILCIVVPVIIVGICFAFKIRNTQGYVAAAMQGLFLHSSVNSACIILTIKIYRQAVLNILLKPFFCYKPKKIATTTRHATKKIVELFQNKICINLYDLSKVFLLQT